MQTVASHKGKLHDLAHILTDHGIHSYSPTLMANFREYGPEFGADSFSEFVDIAKEHFSTLMRNPTHEDYQVLITYNNDIAIDYKYMARGIFTPKGKPLCFYKPRFMALGFSSPDQEFKEFRECILRATYL